MIFCIRFKLCIACQWQHPLSQYKYSIRYYMCPCKNITISCSHVCAYCHIDKLHVHMYDIGTKQNTTQQIWRNTP
nr:MAG TPA: hypothetical protein [Caudoviricetes sp.]